MCWESVLVLAADNRGGNSVDTFASEGVFVSSNTLPTDVLGIWDEGAYARWGLPRYTDPTSGSYIAQYNGATINVTQDSSVRFLRSREASQYVDTFLPDPYYWEEQTPAPNMPGPSGAISLDIPEGELWNVTVSFTVDKKYGDRLFSAALINGSPAADPIDLVDLFYSGPEFVTPPTYGEMIVMGDSVSAINPPTWVDAVDASGVVTSVINSSISGATSTSMRALIEANDPGPAQPQTTDVFVVFFGANDINTTVPSLGVPLITTAEYQENLEWFLDNYPADRQIVVYPWQWTSSFVAGIPVDNSVYLEYRAAALAAAMSRNADFLDGNLITDPTPYQADGIHPNPAGDTLLADGITDILTAPISGPKKSDVVQMSGLCTRDTYLGMQSDYRGGVLAWNFDSSGYYVSDITPPAVPEQPAITWLEPGSRVYERGVDRGVLYFDNGAVVPWQGLTSVDEQIDMGSESVYFDGVKIAEIPVGGGFSAKVSAITYPDQLEEAYGLAPVRDGFSVGDQPQQRFSFSYRNKLGNELTEDLGYKIHLMYNVTALPDDVSHSTISDDIDLVEFGWEFLTIPEHLDGYRPSAHIVFDTSEVSPEIITALELILYGSPTVPPTLPPLNDLLAIIAGFANFITVTDNGDGTWTADTDASGVINDLGGGLVEIQHATIQMTSDNSYLISSTPDAPAI
jgi:lysophospholipase L1-like esterase